MTLDELKAYTDALIDATGDENLKRVRAKMDQMGAPFVPTYPRTFYDPPPVDLGLYRQPLTAPVMPGWPTTTCGSVSGYQYPNAQAYNQ